MKNMKLTDISAELDNLYGAVALYQHYSKRMNSRLEHLWENGELNQERLDQINNMDLHKL